jgi:hypothetical protein
VAQSPGRDPNVELDDLSALLEERLASHARPWLATPPGLSGCPRRGGTPSSRDSVGRPAERLALLGRRLTPGCDPIV